MAAISSVGTAGGPSATQFQAEYQAKVAKLQKDATDMQGDMAMKLIESAAVTPPRSANRLDIRV